jgi:O-6-methylguanine DNA methyltransferase
MMAASIRKHLAGGTPARIRWMWRALLRPGGLEQPPGDSVRETRTYAEVAQAVGRPGAARAVGSAGAANPVAVVIPCHRVVRADGAGGGYRWGVDRKRALLAREARGGSP